MKVYMLYYASSRHDLEMMKVFSSKEEALDWWECHGGIQRKHNHTLSKNIYNEDIWAIIDPCDQWTDYYVREFDIDQ